MNRLSLKDQLVVLVLKNIQDYINLGLTGEKNGKPFTQTEKLNFLFLAHDEAAKLETSIREGKIPE